MLCIAVSILVYLICLGCVVGCGAGVVFVNAIARGVDVFAVVAIGGRFTGVGCFASFHAGGVVS